MTKTFCPLPWKEIASSPSGTVRLCCSSVSSLSHSTFPDGSIAKFSPDLEQSWNTPFFQEAREKMKTGQSVPACENCYRQEKAGLKSPRNSWNEKYPTLFDSNLPIKVKLDHVEQLDLRLGNRCNLKCRMCNPYSSSSWADDWKSLGDLVTPLSESAWARLKKNDWAEDPAVWSQLARLIPNLKRVYLTGGEPLLVAANKLFLKECVSSGHASHIELRYNTNGTVWDEELTVLWSHFLKVRLRVSIDGLNDLNNYIRFPSQWPQIMKNLDRALKLGEKQALEVSIACTAQVYNIFQLPEFLAFFASKKIEVYLDLVHQPSFLSLPVLDATRSALARESLMPWLAHPGVPGLLELLDSSRHNEWPHFVSYTKKLDELRGQNISTQVPELGI